MTVEAVRHATPTVSVVIPCYNYARYLEACVEGVLAQSDVELEVIIVNDASTDDSLAVARSLAERDPRVAVINHELNKGHIATYNDGLSRATGDGVVLLSADDLLAPGSLARSMAVLTEHPRVGLVYGLAETFETEAPEPSTRDVTVTVWRGADWIDRMCARGSNLILNPEALMRRSVLEEVGLYNPRQPQSADMDLWMRAAAVSDVGRVNGPQQAFYRVHGGNMHLSTFAGILADLGARRLTFETFFASAGAAIPDATRLRRRALRAIARDALRRAVLSACSPVAAERALAPALRDFARETDAGSRWDLLVRWLEWRLVRRSRLLDAVDVELDRRRWAYLSRRWRRRGI